MDEARRFLRYVTPGLIFAVQALLLLFIINPAWTTTQLLRQTKDARVGLAVALFLASGASAIYLVLFIIGSIGARGSRHSTTAES